MHDLGMDILQRQRPQQQPPPPVHQLQEEGNLEDMGLQRLPVLVGLSLLALRQKKMRRMKRRNWTMMMLESWV